MNTFLPYPDFQKSAQCLDYKRLGKQRCEAWQVYLALTKENYGWKNHPCIRMWRGYEIALAFYCMAICNEWISRGYKDTIKVKICEKLGIDFPEAYSKEHNIIYPKWLGNEDFHASHRSNLLRKDPEWYGKFGWKEPNNLPYIWG
jgi:hypothetical protein